MLADVRKVRMGIAAPGASMATPQPYECVMATTHPRWGIAAESPADRCDRRTRPWARRTARSSQCRGCFGTGAAVGIAVSIEGVSLSGRRVWRNGGRHREGIEIRRGDGSIIRRADNYPAMDIAVGNADRLAVAPHRFTGLELLQRDLVRLGNPLARHQTATEKCPLSDPFGIHDDREIVLGVDSYIAGAGGENHLIPLCHRIARSRCFLAIFDPPWVRLLGEYAITRPAPGRPDPLESIIPPTLSFG